MIKPASIVNGLLLAILVVGGILLLLMGVYGWTIFVIFPMLLGALASYVFRPTTSGQAAMLGAGAVAFAACSLLFVRWEGIICIVMALPLIAPVGALGGWLMYEIEAAPLKPRSIPMLLVLPFASLTWDVAAPPTVFEVHSDIEIAAAPERVWKHVVTFSELPEPDEWFFRAGLAYPKRARIEGSGVGAIRYCEFSTGPFVEPIEVWDEPRLLRFRVSENPAPMHEWSPYARVLPKHLHGYLISKKGEFRLTALPNGHTRLEGTTLYQHGLWPAEYWRWWSNAIIHRIHLRVLNHIRTLAEENPHK